MAIGLVLGGGAPNLTLMTGALLALDEAGVEFRVITTTGAGMVVGLLYAAPRRAAPRENRRQRLLGDTLALMASVMSPSNLKADSQFNRTELLRMPFRDHIPEERWPEVLDWSYSNMSALFDIGVETGKKFFADNEERLVRSMEYQA